MSISLVMIPIVIAVSVAIKETAFDQLKKYEGEAHKLQPMQTVFNDVNLLTKTLSEHGLPVNVISENKIHVKSGKYELLYSRSSQSEPFTVKTLGWENADKLLHDIECLDKEYKVNVQSYSYEKLVQNLSESNMVIESETILEDNSILLTISV